MRTGRVCRGKVYVEIPEGFSEERMSLCIGIVYPGKCYILTDSRSVIVEKTLSSDKTVIGTTVERDDYKKYVILDVNGEKCVVLSSGSNKFSGKSFSEAMSSIDFSLCKSPREIANVISKELIADGTHYEILFCYHYGLLNVLSVERGTVSQFKDDYNGDGFVWYNIGCKWYEQLLKYAVFPSDNNEEKIKVAIKDFIRRVNIVSPGFDGSVGGKYTLIELCPDGCKTIEL